MKPAEQRREKDQLSADLIDDRDLIVLLASAADLRAVAPYLLPELLADAEKLPKLSLHTAEADLAELAEGVANGTFEPGIGYDLVDDARSRLGPPGEPVWWRSCAATFLRVRPTADMHESVLPMPYIGSMRCTDADRR
ncbi:hypothetical protein BH09ACT8_BH09ACT8_52020 [soil metagenome]